MGNMNRLYMSIDKLSAIISFDQLEIPQTVDEVYRIARLYRIDVSAYDVHLRMDEELLDTAKGYTGGSFDDNEIDLYPLAFANEETLARTQFHEVYHQTQYAEYGYANVVAEHAKYEIITREAELKWWSDKGWLI